MTDVQTDAGMVTPPAEEKRPLLKAAAKRHATLAELLARGESGLKEEGGEFVHDLRVAARRLEEVAKLCEPFVDKATAKAVEGSLKSLRKAMGELRDSDVSREHLSKWRMPGPVKKLAEEVAAELGENRGKLVEGAARQMASASVQGAMVVVARVLEERSGEAMAEASEKVLREEVEEQLKKRAKRLRKTFGKAAVKQSPESLHKARIAAKKLRYVSELGEGGTTEEGLKKQVKFLKGVQELLGDHHDVHVIVEMLEERVENLPAGDARRLKKAWGGWRRTMEKGQAERAAEFFGKSYAWMNRGKM